MLFCNLLFSFNSMTLDISILCLGLPLLYHDTAELSLQPHDSAISIPRHRFCLYLSLLILITVSVIISI